jgi:hypothetical protein
MQSSKRRIRPCTCVLGRGILRFAGWKKTLTSILDGVARAILNPHYLRWWWTRQERGFRRWVMDRRHAATCFRRRVTLGAMTCHNSPPTTHRQKGRLRASSHPLQPERRRSMFSKTRFLKGSFSKTRFSIFYTFHTVQYNIPSKETNQHNAQLNIYPFTSLHLLVSVSVDHLQGACSYRADQLKQYVLMSKI